MQKKIVLLLLVFIIFFSLIFLFQPFRSSFFADLLVQQSKNVDLKEVTEFSLDHEPSPSPKPLEFSMIVGGDLMFDRHIRSKAEMRGNYDFIFDSQLSDYLNSADYALANLEGPITLEQSVSQHSLPGGPGNYTFTFSPDIIPVLQKNNLILLNLGNNHILNFSFKGLESTRQYLSEANLAFFGDVGVNQDWQRYYYLELFGQKIALLSYNQFTEGSKAKTLADLQAVKEANSNLIILLAHWGNEYVSQANQAIVSLAHEFIDTGVDLIIGGHPHVIQNMEVYQGKSIYYSLGNFVFDQYFSAETQEGLLLNINFTFNPQLNDWLYTIEEQRIQMSREGITSFKTKD